MKTIDIIYATKTKHSKRLADAIGKALGIGARNVTDNPILKESELLFIVGGIYGGDSLPELLTFVETLEPAKTKHVALVTSCTSGKQHQVKVRTILEKKGIEVIDEWICPGSFLFFKWGRPNQSDLEQAVRFALSLNEDIH